MKTLRTSATLAMVTLGLALGPAPCRAGLITYTDRDMFESETPGLALQTFGMVRNLGSRGIINTALNSSTDNVFFSPGDILAGLEISGPENPRGSLRVTNAGVGGLTNVSIASHIKGESLSLDFEPTTSAVGIGLINVGDGESALVDISVFDSSAELLATFFGLQANGTGSGAFFGLADTEGAGIFRIVITPREVDSSESMRIIGIDFVGFSPAVTVPEPGSLAMAVIGGGLTMVRVAYRRKKAKAALAD